NVLVRIRRLDVPAPGADGHHQLDLVVQVAREAGIGHGAGLAGVHHHGGVGGLDEEEGRLAAGEAHLLGVFLVVAAHAVDAVDGEALGLADDGNRGDGGRGENVAHDNL